MKVAVITAYYGEDIEIIRRCHESVLAQGSDVTHFLVSDGNPRDDIDTWDCTHIKIPNHADYGDTPRGVGAASAAAKGFDAICFLDADNWYESHHVQTLRDIMVQHPHIQVMTMQRNIYTLDGRLLGICKESDGTNFCDTNCYFVTRAAFPACAAWMFKDSSEGIVGDRRFWATIQQGGYVRAHVNMPTVNYTSTLAFHYQMFDETPPDDSKVIVKVGLDTSFKMVSYAEYKKIVA